MNSSTSRKYRPQTFGSVVGQEVVITTLKNALKFDRISHAYLFCGSRGTGKTTVARLLAKALNCENRSAEQEPCNACSSCLEILEGRSMNVFEIDGASNRGIDDIRQINETVGYAPSSGKYKIYIIDEVHMLTKEAFNALLKTLEEPPPNVKFFFATTEPHKVPATIISRCQRFDLVRLSPKVIVSKLRAVATELAVEIGDDALELIAHLAEGGLRDAESLFDQMVSYAEGPIDYKSVSNNLGLSPRTYFFRLDEAIFQRNLSFAFELAEEVFTSGKEFASFLEAVLDHFRVLLQHKLQLGSHVYLTEAEKKAYTFHASQFSEEEILYILDFVMQWVKEFSRIPFKQVTLEMVLLHLVRSKNRISAQALVRKLQELSENPPPEPAPRVVLPPAAAVSETVALKAIAEASPPPKTPEKMSPTSARYDTMMRFAAVELEGVLKRE